MQQLSKCRICDAPFVFKGNGVYESTCGHIQPGICAVCGEGRTHHVGTAKACYGRMGTVFALVTVPVIDDDGDREPIAEGDYRYYRPQ